MTSFWALFRRDLLLVHRQGSEVGVVVLFFLIGGTLFVFAIGSSAERLKPLAAAIVLVMAALASLLSLDRLFQSDFDDGSLDQMVLSALPLELVVICKFLIHWLSTGLPLLIAGVPLAAMLGGDGVEFPQLLMALGLVTPALSLLGTLGAALTLGARSGGLLLIFLILPLFIPVLIFGAAIAQPGLIAADQETFPLAILISVNLGLVSLVPWGAAAALKQAL